MANTSNIIYKGNLSMLGNAKIMGGNQSFIYSLIEIGNDTIKGVRVSGTLNNYLERALQNAGDVELELKETFGFTQLFKFAGIGIAAGAVSAIISSALAAIIIAGTFFISLFMLFGIMNMSANGSFYNLIAVTIDGKRYTN